MSIYSKCYKLEKIKELWNSGRILCEELNSDFPLWYAYKHGEFERIEKFVPELKTIPEILEDDSSLKKISYTEKQDFKSWDELMKYLDKQQKSTFNLLESDNKYESSDKLDPNIKKWTSFESELLQKSDGIYLYLSRMGKHTIKNIGLFGNSYIEVYHFCLYVLFRSTKGTKILKDQGIEE